MRLTNVEMISAILDGEIHRYDEIVRQFDDRVRHVITLKVSDPAAVEDLTQETFYKAFKSLGTLSDPGKFEGWLITIAKNCMTDYFRSRSARAQSNNDSHLEIVGETIGCDCDWVWEEVDELTNEQSQVLRLRYQLSLTYAEIAAKLNVETSTVRGRIFEARKSLRQRLIEKRLFP